MSIIQIDKITAAGCQIDTAIELFFSKGDIISQAVLVYSAWSVVKDLLKNTPQNNSSVRETLEKRTYKALNDMWCFLKHAHTDPQKIYQFPKEIVEDILFSVIHDFGLLHITSKTMDKFYNYFKSEKLVIPAKAGIL